MVAGRIWRAESLRVRADVRNETAGVRTRRRFKAGVRQFTYSEDGGALRIWVNGRRFIPRGGNWGFGESMLRYRGREYDAAVRYHRDMNFTMIRNWVGQIGDEAFYEACDRTASWCGRISGWPIRGTARSPTTTAMFLRNVRRLRARSATIRRSACIVAATRAIRRSD